MVAQIESINHVLKMSAARPPTMHTFGLIELFGPMLLTNHKRKFNLRLVAVVS